MIEWWGPILHEYYAATEGNGADRSSARRSGWQQPGSVGRRRARRRPHLRRATARELPAGRGRHGLLRARRRAASSTTTTRTRRARRSTPSTRPGRTRRRHRLRSTRTATCYLTDRKAFMIISGGVNIYPQEIENVLDPAPDGVRRRRDRRARRRDGRGGQGGRRSPRPASSRHARARARADRPRARAHRRTTRRRAASTSSTSLPRTPTGKLVKRQAPRALLAGSGKASAGRGLERRSISARRRLAKSWADTTKNPLFAAVLRMARPGLEPGALDDRSLQRRPHRPRRPRPHTPWTYWTMHPVPSWYYGRFRASGRLGCVPRKAAGTWSGSR